MASSNLKYVGCLALAQWLEERVPCLVGKIGVASADWEEPTSYPSLRILPQRMSFDGYQADEVDDTQDEALITEVGSWTGNVELRLVAESSPKREALEAELIEALLSSDELSPGDVVVETEEVTVGGLQSNYKAAIWFGLSEEEWRDELAFSKKRFSFLTLEMCYPALAARLGVPTIDAYQVGLSAGTNVDPEDENTPITETISVDEDGTITQVP